eukprot:gi/632951906/ref/XP_007891555.1/ PREDICTED: uncharacterized protein LOC103178544 [Callorhinchus milii]
MSSEEKVSFINVKRLRASHKLTVKSSTPIQCPIENKESSNQNVQLSRIVPIHFEPEKLFTDSLSPSISPVPKAAKSFLEINDCESSKEMSPTLNNTLSGIQDVTSHTNMAKQWSTGISSKSISFRGPILSTVHEESPFSDLNLAESDEQINMFSNEKDFIHLKENSLKNLSAFPKSQKQTNKKSAQETIKGRRYLSWKALASVKLDLPGISISKKKRQKKRVMPVEQEIRIRQWTIRQLTNIEEAKNHELVIEAE